MFKEYKLEYLKKDIPAGIIVALVSIPISMGYAQVSGLPVVYGLYGSLLPILIFGFITSSPQFVFGIDAAPSALVGGLIATIGVAAGSGEAVRIVPVITMVTAVWLLLFYFLKAGRFTNLISTPVMGGFISGIGFTIITMQVPKLFGGDVTEGEFIPLLINIFYQIFKGNFGFVSLLLGLTTIVIIRFMAKRYPRIPMSVVMMFAGALLSAMVPLAYTLGNIASALTGCGPVSGSVSRTSIAAQFGSRSQVMSIFACGSMALMLLFGTDFIAYLPVPVLTGIVISALMSILEFDLAKQLKMADRSEWMIFYAAFFGVLLCGTIYGVLIGMMLSFVAVAVRAVVPPKAYMGCIQGKDGFYALKRNRNARPIKNTVIYRFSGTLFFANVGKFQEDIENAAGAGVHQIIVDARGIGNIDITAAERLEMISEGLKARGIRFYITEHTGAVNDRLVKFGKGRLIEEGIVKRHIEDALEEAGLVRPYPLEPFDDDDGMPEVHIVDDRLAEFEWAFGENADKRMKDFARKLAGEMASSGRYDPSRIGNAKEILAMGHWDVMDEEDLLDYIEMELALISDSGDNELDEIKEQIEDRRDAIITELMNKNQGACEMINERRRRNEEEFCRKHPEIYAEIEARHKKHQGIMGVSNTQ